MFACSVITVHGIRDDRSTAWTTWNGDNWISDKLFPKYDIRQLDYSYEIDNSARIFQRNGIDLEARALLKSLARLRAKDPEVSRRTGCYLLSVKITISRQNVIGP